VHERIITFAVIKTCLVYRSVFFKISFLDDRLMHTDIKSWLRCVAWRCSWEMSTAKVLYKFYWIDYWSRRVARCLRFKLVNGVSVMNKSAILKRFTLHSGWPVIRKTGKCQWIWQLSGRGQEVDQNSGKYEILSEKTDANFCWHLVAFQRLL